MSALRRYEILLPSQFNDGRTIPPDSIADTLQELEQAFGAVSCETQAIQGCGTMRASSTGTAWPARLLTWRTRLVTGCSSCG